ncbi:acyltransferase [Sphingomonas sp. I4]
MLFYALLALVVTLPRGRALAAMAVLLGLGVAAGTVLPGPSALWFWTRPIILDFALGMLVGAFVGRGIILPRGVRILLAVGGAALLLADPAHIFDGPIGTTVANAWPRVLLAGMPVAVVLAAAVLGPEPRLPRLALPFTRIGDASYSLYLFHPFALIATEKLAQKLPFVRESAGWPLVAATVAVAILVALAAHRWIERPMNAALARRFVRPAPKGAFAPRPHQENEDAEFAPTMAALDGPRRCLCPRTRSGGDLSRPVPARTGVAGRGRPLLPDRRRGELQPVIPDPAYRCGVPAGVGAGCRRGTKHVALGDAATARLRRRGADAGE